MLISVSVHFSKSDVISSVRKHCASGLGLELSLDLRIEFKKKIKDKNWKFKFKYKKAILEQCKQYLPFRLMIIQTAAYNVYCRVTKKLLVLYAYNNVAMLITIFRLHNSIVVIYLAL